MWWDWHQVGTLVAIISAINGGFLWATKVMMESQRNAITERIAEMVTANVHQDQEIEALKAKLARLELNTSENYIRREDAIIYFGRFEQKIDAVWKHLLEMSQGSGGSAK